MVHGDGSSFWTACHRNDVARAFVNAAYNQNTFGRAYHTNGDEWITWDVYVRRAAEGVGAPSPKIVHISTDILARVAPKRAFVVVTNLQFSNIFDTSAVKSDLDFRYTIPWVEGARRMAAWLEENNRWENSDEDPFEDTLKWGK